MDYFNENFINYGPTNYMTLGALFTYNHYTRNQAINKDDSTK